MGGGGKFLLRWIHMRNIKNLVGILSLGATIAAPRLLAQGTFCNPVDLSYRFVVDRKAGETARREAADPTMIVHGGRYYLFPSKCGGYYRSDDLAHWTLIRSDSYEVEGYAPAVVEIGGALYLTTSVHSGTIYRCRDLDQGKWDVFTDKFPWRGECDPTWLNDDGRLYFFAGSSNDPKHFITGTELDPRTMLPLDADNGRSNLVAARKGK